MNKKINIIFVFILGIGIILSIITSLLIGFQFSSEVSNKVVEIVTSITSILAVFGLIIAILQLGASQKQNNITIDIKQKETSVALMKDFARYLKQISFIQQVLETDKLFINLINTIKIYELKHFNQSELLNLFDDKQFGYLTDISGLFERNISKIGMIYYQYYGYNEPDRVLWLRYIGCNWDNKKLKQRHTNDNITDNKYYVDELNMNSLRNKLFIVVNDSIQDMLNHFEHFCTNFNTGLADEAIAYNSLHQVFFSFIKFCYPHICLANKDNLFADYYYSNIVELFLNWVQKYQNECKKEQEIKHSQFKEKINANNRMEK